MSALCRTSFRGRNPPLFDDLAALFLGAQIATEVVKMVLGLNQSDGANSFAVISPTCALMSRAYGKTLIAPIVDGQSRPRIF